MTQSLGERHQLVRVNGTRHLVIQGECTTVMAQLAADERIRLDWSFTDLPYGTTYARWDSPIDLDAFWPSLLQMRRDAHVPMMFTAQQPFTSRLVMSRPELFKVEWIWNKVHGTNFANANRQPLKVHEQVLVFYERQVDYSPIKTPGARNHTQGDYAADFGSESYLIRARGEDDLSGMKHPKTIVRIPKHSSSVGLHPNQKLVELVLYFLRTYASPGQLGLDATAGSGTTAVAAARYGCHSIAIEENPTHFDTTVRRLRELRV